MSFSRLRSDGEAYAQDLRQSLGAGYYLLGTPKNDCQPCFFVDPAIRLGTGASRCPNRDLTDLDSELIGITRKRSRCPTKQFLPGKTACAPVKLGDCRAMSTEDTRLSNPPCTLRGTDNGFNRWEWLCKDPQQAAEVPFPTNINYRLVVKDNWRPCLPRPIDSPPLAGGAPAVYVPDDARVADTTVPNLSWRECQEIAKW